MQRWARPAHALVQRQRGERVGEALASGRAQLEVELQRGNQHEAPLQQLRVRQRHALLVQLELA